MLTRAAEATWEGNLTAGRGRMEFDAYQGPYSFHSRMENGPGTNPEELLAAAHAGCYSMALAAGLVEAGARPAWIRTRAEVRFGRAASGFAVSDIELITEAVVANVEEGEFQRIASEAEKNCPVSKALAATPITLRATLLPSDARRAG